jgi:hypothetical protein
VEFGQKIALRIGTRQIVRMSEIKEKSFQIWLWRKVENFDTFEGV